jgi:hypothetical protein
MKQPQYLRTFLLQVLCTLAVIVVVSTLNRPADAYFGSGSNGADAGNNGYSQGSYSSYSQGSYGGGDPTNSDSGERRGSYSQGSYSTGGSGGATGGISKDNSSGLGGGSNNTSGGGGNNNPGSGGDPTNTTNGNRAGSQYSQSSYNTSLGGSTANNLKDAINKIASGVSSGLSKMGLDKVVDAAKAALGISNTQDKVTDFSKVSGGATGAVAKDKSAGLGNTPTQDTSKNASVPDQIKQSVDKKNTSNPVADQRREQADLNKEQADLNKERAEFQKQLNERLANAPKYTGQGTPPSPDMVKKMQDPQTSVPPSGGTTQTQTPTPGWKGNPANDPALGGSPTASKPSTDVPQVDLAKLAALSKGKYDIDKIVTPDVAKKIAINNTPVLSRDQFAKDIEHLTPEQQKIAGITANQAGVQGLPVGIGLGMNAIESGFGSIPDRPGSQYQGPAQIGNEEFNKFATDESLKLGKTDPYANIQAGVSYMNAIRKDLISQGVENPTVGDVYGAYNQGPTGYASLKNNPNDTAVEALGKAGVPANRALERVTANLPDSLKDRAASMSAQEFADTIASYPTDKYAQYTDGGKLPEGPNPGSTPNTTSKATQKNNTNTSKTPESVPNKNTTPNDVPKKTNTVDDFMTPSPNDTTTQKVVRTIINAVPGLRTVVDGFGLLEKTFGSGDGSGTKQGSGGDGTVKNATSTNTTSTQSAVTTPKSASENAKNALQLLNVKHPQLNYRKETYEEMNGKLIETNTASFNQDKELYRIAYIPSPVTTSSNTTEKGYLVVDVVRTLGNSELILRYQDIGVNGTLDNFFVNGIQITDVDTKNQFSKEYVTVLQTIGAKTNPQ